MSNRNKLLIILLLLTLLCSTQQQGRGLEFQPPPVDNSDSAQRGDVKVWIADLRKIYVQRSGARPRLLLRARREAGWSEGFVDPELSPNGRWLRVWRNYPVDVAGTKNVQYLVLVNIETGRRINQYDLGKVFGIKGRVMNLEWIKDKPATLHLSLDTGPELTDISELKLDLPNVILANKTK